MVLLPLIYLGMIAAVGWWLCDYATNGLDATSSGTGRSSKGGFWLYIVPLIVGAMVIVFMIKPLFSRRPKSVEPRRLKPEDEPELFEFIGQICDLVGAPRPKRVQVDLQVNASAGLTHGFWSLFSRNLTLTIGLPLAGGLSTRELGGVLAHEFGHFAQGAGMMTTYMVRVVSMWFARVVYERDRWDATLDAWAKDSDFRIMIVLQIARFFIWCVRRILWVLMMVGQLISSVLMRQMEFDADHYEIQSGGTEAFIATSRRMRILNVGSQVANSRMAQSYQSRRLVDNLPGFMTLEAELLTDETRKKIAEASAEEKTGWLDSHPSDKERIAAAERAAAAGVLTGEEPGTELFRDFAALSREVTMTYYRDVLELPVKDIALLPLDDMAKESHGSKRGGEAMDTFFHGALTARTLMFLAPEDLALEAPGLIARNKAARLQTGDAEKERAKELAEALDREHVVRSVKALTSAKIPLKDLAALKLDSTKLDYLTAESMAVAAKLDALEVATQPVLATCRERLASALSFLLSLPETDPALNGEIRRFISILRCLQGIDPTLRGIRTHSIGLGAVLNAMEGSSDQQAVYAVASNAADALKPLVERVLAATKEVAYPFPHAGGIVTLAVYLTSDVNHSDAIIRDYLKSDAILDRVFQIYGRIMGRLAVLALEAEAQMEPLEIPSGANGVVGGLSKNRNSPLTVSESSPKTPRPKNPL
jgi:Zn-dependent protease with chaperone function